MKHPSVPAPWFLLLLGLLSTGPGGPSAYAQRVLTIEECLARTFQNYPAARISDLNIRASEAALDEQRRSLLPPLRLNLSAIYAPHSARYGYDADVTDGGQVAAQVGVTQTIYDGGARGAKSEQLSLDIDRSRLEKRRTMRDLRWTVFCLYTDAVEQFQLNKVQRRRCEDIAGYSVLATHLTRGGGGGGSDLLKIRIALENARNALAKTELQIMSAKLALAAMMGTPLDTAFEVESGDPANSLRVADSLLSAADTTSPMEIAAAELAVRHAVLELDVARAAELPTVSLSADAGYLSSFDKYRLPPAERLTPVGASFGILIEHPLFGWGAPGQRVLQREIDVESARLTLEQEKQAATSGAMRARGELVASRGQLAAFKRIINDAEDHYALVRAAYMGGTATALEVLSAEDALSDAREGVIHATADIGRSLASLKRFSAR
jgi:outer membrane protein